MMRATGNNGIALPIRMVVLMVLGVSVLLVSIAFITQNTGSEQINCEAKLQSTCLKYLRCGCCESHSCLDCPDDDHEEIFEDYEDACGAVSNKDSLCC